MLAWSQAVDLSIGTMAFPEDNGKPHKEVRRPGISFSLLSNVDAPLIKLQRQNHTELEIKIYFKPDAWLDAGMRYKVKIVSQRSLGTISKETFINSVSNLTRLGFDQEDLSVQDLLSRWPAWEELLDQLVCEIAKLAPDPDNSAVLTKATVLAKMMDFEESLRVLGCLLKSAIRDQCREIEMKCKTQSLDLQWYFDQLNEIIENVDRLKTRLEILVLGPFDHTVKSVLSRLDEFILMGVRESCAKLAKTVGPSVPIAYELSCALALKAHETLVWKNYNGASSPQNRSAGIPVAAPKYNHETQRRLKNLKYYFLSVLDLQTIKRTPSAIWAEIVAMFFAGLAMFFAVLILWASERQWDRASVELIVVLTVGYIFKDRVKDWGKRFVIPLLKEPHVISCLKTGRVDTRAVGCVNEWYHIKERYNSSQVQFQHKKESKDKPLLMGHIGELSPENEFVYTREIKLDRKRWVDYTPLHCTRHATLSDIAPKQLVQTIRIDLSHFCSHMESSHTQHTTIDPTTGTPCTIRCSQSYQFRVSVDIEYAPQQRRLCSKGRYSAVCSQGFLIEINRDSIIDIHMCEEQELPTAE
uniref:Uncharacterized protein n=1 Tax=Mucochytrium quahogii TaxID=96639 RepID=A0A7S2S1M8_9STRA|mmetsp:Transcript_40701/g.65359  ORF Transcript_40701/g.65359 Transcript_40701/m.65359 type:complete len:584 (-) Transcript_40701:20-1771(-)